jgi:hypothetical protein
MVNFPSGFARLNSTLMVSFSHIREHVIDKLEKGLSPALTYHNVPHTWDVLRQAENIAQEEGIKNENELLLLKVGALYHDVGFIDVYSGHEERSCELAKPELEKFGFSAKQIDKVFGLIRATRVPQQPQNLLEEILCDSDLDYLGRSDFFSIGEGLYQEFLDQKIVSNYLDWNLLQIRFLESHHYFTKTSKLRRQIQKQQHLEEIKQRVRISA